MLTYNGQPVKLIEVTTAQRQDQYGGVTHEGQPVLEQWARIRYDDGTEVSVPAAQVIIDAGTMSDGEWVNLVDERDRQLEIQNARNVY